MASKPRPGAGGPKSDAGKARSAQNARTHGLSLPPSVDPALANDIERLARSIAGDGAPPARLAAARAVAECHIDLRRIRAARELAMLRPWGGRLPPTRDLIYASQRIAAKRPDCRVAGIVRRLQRRDEVPAPHDAAACRLKEIVRLERYERRAFSRRSAAVRILDALV
jgi:hypothetical protein